MVSEEQEALIDRLVETAQLLDAITHELLTQIRELDRSGAWHRMGAHSCAHFLSWRLHMGRGVAREKVRVANALADLPRIDAAFAAAQISYSKVRALTRVARPDNEDLLLQLAEYATAAQLEKICRLYRQTQTLPVPGDPKREEDRRWVRSRATDDGMVRLTIQLRPEEAASVMKAIDVSAETGGRADKLVDLAERTLSGGERTKPPVEVMLHVDAASMQGHIDETGDGVSAETARRLCCDAGIVPVLDDDEGEPLDVGRKSRSVPAALRRALHVRDGGRCRFPGCDNRIVDAHHIEHWANGGETRLRNMISLCRHHHRYVHEYGYDVTMSPDGEPVFRDEQARRVPPNGLRPWLSKQELQELVAEARARNPFDPDAQPLRWNGTPADYDWIVHGLCARDQRQDDGMPPPVHPS